MTTIHLYECADCKSEFSMVPMREMPHCPNCQSLATAYSKHDIRSLHDDEYPNVTFGWNEVDQSELDITASQASMLFKKWKQDDQGMMWREFAKTVQPTFHMNNAVVVKWSGMFLCIEEDGYCHT